MCREEGDGLSFFNASGLLDLQQSERLCVRVACKRVRLPLVA